MSNFGVLMINGLLVNAITADELNKDWQALLYLSHGLTLFLIFVITMIYRLTTKVHSPIQYRLLHFLLDGFLALAFVVLGFFLFLY
jgi:hypothetical protein